MFSNILEGATTRCVPGSCKIVSAIVAPTCVNGFSGVSRQLFAEGSGLENTSDQSICINSRKYISMDIRKR